MQAGYTGTDKRLKYLFDNATEVSAAQVLSSGTPIGTITIDGQTLTLYAPEGGGSNVTYTEGLQSGDLVGTLSIDGVSHNLYCTEVEANPSGTATRTLTTINIDGTVYEIQGGGGSGGEFDYEKITEFYSVVENQVDVTHHTPYSITYSSSSPIGDETFIFGAKDDLEGYDAILFVGFSKVIDGARYYEQSETQLILVNDIKEATFKNTSGGKYYYNWSSDMCYDIGRVGWREETHDPQVQDPDLYLALSPWPIDSNEERNIDIVACYAIKFGGGTNVVPNPSDTPTDDLTSIKIGDTVYDIPGGGSANYGKFTCDVIFNTVSSTSQNSQPITIGTEELISSYDAIIIEASGDSDDYAQTSEFILTKSIASLNEHYIVGNKYDSNVAITKGYFVTYDNGDCKVYTSTGVLLKIYKVYGLKFENNLIYLPSIYSEAEREVGVWTDGRPIYQKTYRNVQASNNSDTTIDANFGSTKNIVSFQSVGHADNNGYQYPVQSYSSAGDAAFPKVISGALILHVRDNWSAWVCDVTVQYTKTTDAPGSGTWTPDGNLSHHYSTTEHIIGTWIDGSTIYERTWDLGSDVSLSQNTWVDTSISNSNLSMITYSECLTSSGTHRGQVEADVNSTGSYVQLRSDGVNATVRYVTLQYTKTTS